MTSGPGKGTRPTLARASVGRVPLPGPLVIESYDTTIVVPPRCSVRADAVGNIIIDLEEAAA